MNSNAYKYIPAYMHIYINSHIKHIYSKYAKPYGETNSSYCGKYCYMSLLLTTTEKLY